MPVVVAVTYDAANNQAYLYLESAVTSYIMMLAWSGGSWCYQVMFEVPASRFSKYMYHSLLLWKSYLYWSNDRHVMSGRVPGYEQRLLIQPAWNQVCSKTVGLTEFLLK